MISLKNVFLAGSILFSSLAYAMKFNVIIVNNSDTGYYATGKGAGGNHNWGSGGFNNLNLIPAHSMQMISSYDWLEYDDQYAHQNFLVKNAVDNNVNNYTLQYSKYAPAILINNVNGNIYAAKNDSTYIIEIDKNHTQTITNNIPKGIPQGSYLNSCNSINSRLSTNPQEPGYMITAICDGGNGQTSAYLEDIELTQRLKNDHGTLKFESY